MLSQLQEQDGVKAWRIVNRSHSESSAASESHYLQQFLQQKLETSATDGEEPSMRSYIEKLSSTPSYTANHGLTMGKSRSACGV